jgi:acyl-coenzyme A synthetase/AMP-(fatty) acid ligase
VIRRGGENISALEVETALLRHPGIAQVAVTAVHDELRGEEVMAFVVPAPHAARDAAAAGALAQWALGEMAYYKVPGWVAFVDAVPVTPTQKIQRGSLRALGENALKGSLCHDLRPLKKRVA